MTSLQPGPLLAPFVERLWYRDERDDTCERAERERVVPTGRASLVVRLSDEPVRVYRGANDPRGDTFGHAVVGGMRSAAYVRDVRAPSVSLGAQFRPGGAAAFFGVSAHELADRHTPLDALWGSAAHALRERLLAARRPAERLALFEAELARRAQRAQHVHPSIAAALRALDVRGAASVDAAWRASGFSRRHFIACFRREVGLAPKVFARLERFQLALTRAPRSTNWTDVAAASGYADQSHLVREFRAFTGLAPSRYQPLAGRPNHVPIAGSR